MSSLEPEEVEQLLSAEAAAQGGKLISWELDQIDASPQGATTALYATVVDWPYGRRDELFGLSFRGSGREVWQYPNDPDLPGLARATFVDPMAELINRNRLYPFLVRPDQIRLRMIAYRPRRRAVVRLDVVSTQDTYYTKVVRAKYFAGVRHRHVLLRDAGVPVPKIVAETDDYLLVLKRLSGVPLAKAIFVDASPTTAQDLIATLDAMPEAIAKLERRPPWVAAVDHYGDMIKAVAPSLAVKIDWVIGQIHQGLDGCPVGNEPTHGDFHEGQVFVDRGRVSGLLDVDTAGPGRRADDLACLMAHLATIQRMNQEQTQQVHRLIAQWVPVFDERVDPIELRLRAAGVIISLATGPYRAQEADWERQTRLIVNAAVALVRQIS